LRIREIYDNETEFLVIDFFERGLYLLLRLLLVEALDEQYSELELFILVVIIFCLDREFLFWEVFECDAIMQVGSDGRYFLYVFCELLFVFLIHCVYIKKTLKYIWMKNQL
jgi:hypothetical protein